MIETAFIIALIVLFAHICTWEGMIFEGAAMQLHSLPSWLKKPLYDCPICMPMWWGWPIYWLLGYVLNVVPYLHPAACFFALCMAGAINTVLIYVIQYGKFNSE